MMSGFNYLVQVNCYLLLFYAFYAVFLRNETFFSLNRAYLVGTSLLSLIIPAIRVEWMHTFHVTQQVGQAGHLVSAAIKGEDPSFAIPATEELGFYAWLKLVYFCGTGFFLLRLLKRLSNLRNPNDEGKAYSFFKRVVVPSDATAHDTIYLHERTHSLQWHSLDVVFFEIISILIWFNPAIYLFKRSIRHIHEFIADEEAAKSRESKADYAYLLVNNAFGVSPPVLGSPFYNQSFLKKRIAMLHKTRSAKTALWKYGLSAPLFAGMLVLSSATALAQPVTRFSGKLEDIALTTVEMLLPGNTPRTGEEAEQAVANASGRVQEQGFAKPDSTVINFLRVDEKPEFPGGQKSVAVYAVKKFKWPVAAVKAGGGGKVVLGFIIDKDGSVTDVNVLRDPGMGIGEEAARVIRTMPKWKPGKMAGNPVRVAFVLPLSFAVSGGMSDGNGQSLNR